MANLLAVRAIAVASGKCRDALNQPRNLSDAGLAQLPVIDARLSPAFGDCFVDIRIPLAGPNGRLAPI